MARPVWVFTRAQWGEYDQRRVRRWVGRQHHRDHLPKLHLQLLHVGLGRARGREPVRRQTQLCFFCTAVAVATGVQPWLINDASPRWPHRYFDFDDKCLWNTVIGQD
jgi:hypothetical protein